MTQRDTAARALGEDRIARVRQAVEDWVKQLIDLTGRNQLLYYRSLRRGTLELTHASQAAMDTLLSGRTIRLSNLLPATEENPTRHDDALRRARTIHRKALAYFEERGIETLFLAWGMATWTTATSQATPAAPVLLSPIELAPRGAAEADFDLALQGDWDVNNTFLHLLATEFKVHVDADQLLQLLEETKGLPPDPTRLFQRLSTEAADIPEFDIHPRFVVGTFAYTKLPMVRDLQESVTELAAHDLVSAIAGVEEAREAIRELRAGDVDPTMPDYTPPSDEFLILDADASQNMAINAALVGEPLIIQGPPGTGKSQTIANLIASTTARGKRVLFVAEKRAAIDAVTKRLRKVGLGNLVMDLHGGVTSKKQLARDLAQTLQDIGRIPDVEMTDLHDKLETTRSALTHHAQAMHEKREPWGLSIWEVNQRLLDLADDGGSGFRFTGDRLTDLTADVARQVRDRLAEWADLGAPLIDGRSPWAGTRITTESDARQALQLLTDLAHDAVPKALARLDLLLTDTGLPVPGAVEDWRRNLALLSALADTLATVAPAVWNLDLEDLAQALQPGSRSWFQRTIAQLFNRRYRQGKTSLRRVWTGEGKPDGRQLHVAVAAARHQVAEWQDLGGRGAPRLAGDLDGALSAYNELTSRLAALGAYLISRDLAARPHREVGEDVRQLLADQTTLFRLPRLHELEEWLASHHLAPLMQAIREGEIGREQVVACFEHAWLSSIRTHVTARDPRLANFDGTLQSRRVHEFRETDRHHLESTASRLRRAVGEHAIAVRNAHQDQDQIVAAQARRKRGHMTLRKLFEQSPDVLTALRPCWVMSPLVVSQTLPARQVFDIVIFDEASQVLPADAVPALLRAPQAIIAGDRHQLPPTTFFDATIEEDDEEREDDGAGLTIGFESVLDVLDALLRDYMLTWHYRSEDERLIAFSNHNVYHSALTTFPGAVGRDCLEHVPIRHRPNVRVDSRSNDDEVARVVELMIDHAYQRPDQSLGVIAMGLHHAGRIDAALRQRLLEAADPKLDAFFDESREERAFIKNLERVQGDERDAIILTIGYAKQPDGRLLYRFGPLNQQGGERRLNVAVTRARRWLTVVSSFSHTDMEPGRSSAEGVELLRRYLKYAESGAIDLEGAHANIALNPFEISVKRWLDGSYLPERPGSPS